MTETPAETISRAIDKLERLIAASTPGDPHWTAQADDLIGGFCVMPVNATPGDSGLHEIACFTSRANAELIQTLHAVAPALLASFRGVLHVHEDLAPLPFDDYDAWPVPAHILDQAKAILA